MNRYIHAKLRMCGSTTCIKNTSWWIQYQLFVCDSPSATHTKTEFPKDSKHGQQYMLACFRFHWRWFSWAPSNCDLFSPGLFKPTRGPRCNGQRLLLGHGCLCATRKICCKPLMKQKNVKKQQVGHLSPCQFFQTPTTESWASC